MSEESFLREVEDELRSDRLRSFWRRFAPFVIGAAVLVVLAVAGNELWNWWRSSQATAAAERFYAASNLAEAGDTDGAIAAFRAIADDGPQGYATLASFREAALLGSTGDTQGAVAIYDTLGNSAPEARLRELALVLAAYLLVDSGDVPAVQTRIAGIIDGNSPMRLAAREALGLAQYRAGDIDAARASFETLASEAGANQDLQGRALVYLEFLSSETIAEAGALPGEPALEDPGLDTPEAEAVEVPVEEPEAPAAQ